MDDVSKAKITTKVNERRQPHQQIEARTTNLTPLKNDNSHVIPSKNNAAKSPVKKMLIEADKIVKIGVAKEFDLFEKENAIQVNL